LKEEHNRTWGEQLVAGQDVEMNIDHDSAEQIKSELDNREVTQEDIQSLKDEVLGHDDAVANGIDTIINKIDGLSVSLDAAERKQLARDIAEELR
jgi:hypothetical protein